MVEEVQADEPVSLLSNEAIEVTAVSEQAIIELKGKKKIEIVSGKNIYSVKALIILAPTSVFKFNAFVFLKKQAI